MTAGRRRQGRPGSEVLDSKGKLVDGLSYRQGRYFHPTGRRDINFGTDRLAAIQKFRIWEARQPNKTVEITEVLATNKSGRIEIVNVHELPADLVILLFKEWMSDPVKCQMLEEGSG